MSDRELGDALLKLAVTDLAGGPDPRDRAWQVIEKDRRRVRLLTWLTVAVWVFAGLLVLAGLVNYGLVMPAQAKLGFDAQAGLLTPAQQIEGQREVLMLFLKGTLLIAFSGAVMAAAALCTVFLIRASGRATLRQVNANLAEIAGQLRRLSPPPAAP